MLKPRDDEERWKFLARFMRNTKMIERYNTLENRKVKALIAWSEHKQKLEG